jgi:N,N'-diacetyllegionaminate synthase
MSKVWIIAEGGVNHNGDLETGKKLIDAAKDAGADVIKFQTFKAEKIASRSAKKASYQVKNMQNNDDSQFSMLKKLELTEQMHEDLQKYCIEKKIEFLSTPFNLDSIHFLQSLGISVGKIPSGEITNLPYLEEMAKTFPRIILSTGMCYLSEIKDALNILLKCGTKKENIVVLHCNTEYPTPMEDVNLLAMLTIKNELGVKVGYSDHTLGIEVPIAAVALGADVIEKHLTLDRNMEGPDHRSSLEPGELKQMVTAIRNIELALGTGIKEPTPSERKNISIARKSLVSTHKLEPGHIITMDDITTKRPGNGISPMRIHEVIGKKLVCVVEADEVLTEAHFVK